MTRLLLAALLFAAPAALAQTAPAQTYAGALEAADDTLSTGEYADEFSVRAEAGETVTAVVEAEGFDPWVFLKDAAGRQEDNDDCDGSRSRSCAAFAADADGIVRILVTSFAPRETGRYTVTITTGPAGRSAAAAPRRP